MPTGRTSTTTNAGKESDKLMTDYQNAESLRREYLTRTPRKTLVNVCKARPRWNGCDYCDVYSGTGLECWKQDAPHNCCYCKQEQRKGATETC